MKKTMLYTRWFFTNAKRKIMLLAVALLSATGQAAYADSQVFNLDKYFTLAPGSPPTVWSPVPITVSFGDLAGGGVRMRVKANASFGTNEVASVLFNVKPALATGSLTFTASPFSDISATSITMGSTGGGLKGVGIVLWGRLHLRHAVGV